MKLSSSILIASMLLVANSGIAQDRAAPMRTVAHPPPNIEESTRYGWAVVLRVDPIYEQTDEDASAPKQDCVDVPNTPPPPPRQDTRAGGTVIGAIVGGVIGNIFGKGNGRKAATAVGVVAGGVIGNNVAVSNDNRANDNRAQFDAADAPPPPSAAERHCRDARAQRRISGYDVEYRYGGEVYMAHLAYDPGDRMRVRISVVPAE